MTRPEKTAARSGVRSGLVVLAAALALTGCSHGPATGDGPAEVSVTKAAAPAVAGDQTHLARFDIDTVPGASSLEWSRTLSDVWLPQAASVLPGLGESTEQSGSIYLRVPARYPVVAAALQDNQGPAGGLRAPDDLSVVRSTDPVGTVLTVTVAQTVYVLSVSPDAEGDDGFSIVLVQWSPLPTPTPAAPSTAPSQAPSQAPVPGPGAAPGAAGQTGR